MGEDVYRTLVKGYTEKQWGKACKDLPAFIIGRLPLRFVYDNNYFNDSYQGIPVGGYTKMIENMLDGIDVRTNVDFLPDRKGRSALAHTVVYTGAIDKYFDYKFGGL